MQERVKSGTTLREIALLFLKLGITGFGGPAVHIAMMEKEVVRKKKWMDRDHFLDLVGATNLIPGPNSTEMTMHIGRERAGAVGLVVAGCCFILPAVLITGLFAWGYQQYGHLPEVYPFIYGVKPAIIAVVLSVTLKLIRQAWKGWHSALFAAATLIAVLSGLHEILTLFGAGMLGMSLAYTGKRSGTLPVLSPMLLKAASLTQPGNWQLLTIFLKVGSLLYGSGYVLFAFLDAELVAKGYLSRQVLTDAIAAGQFTPGPVFSSATFIGWQIGGIAGAVGATIGIFLPSFLFVALLNPLVKKLRASKVMSSFLDAVNIAAVILILVMLAEMGAASVQGWRTAAIAVAGVAVTLLYPNLNTAWIILGGAFAGYLLLLV